MKCDQLKRTTLKTGWKRFNGRHSLFNMLTIGGLCLFFACSGKTIRKVDEAGHRFLSQKPPLTVELVDKDGTQYRGSKVGLFKATGYEREFKVEVHYFQTQHGPFEIALIDLVLPPTQKYYHSDEWYAEQFMSGTIIGQHDIGGVRWQKMIRLGDRDWFSKNKDWLYAGYFTKKQDYLIYVSTGVDMLQHGFSKKELKKTRTPTGNQSAFFNLLFNRSTVMYRIVK